MQDEVEGCKARILDEEEAVKKRPCNTKQHPTFKCETTGEDRQANKGVKD